MTESTAIAAAVAVGATAPLENGAGQGLSVDDADGSAASAAVGSTVFEAQQRDLAVHGARILTVDPAELLLLSPTARRAKRLREIGSLVCDCNEAARFAGREEVFKPTTRLVASVHALGYFDVSDRESLGAFVDRLFWILYEGAGDDSLRFLAYLDRDTECRAVWAVKQLRNKFFRHDIGHGKERDIAKGWDALRDSLTAIGVTALPATPADCIRLFERLVDEVHSFLQRLLERIRTAAAPGQT